MRLLAVIQAIFAAAFLLVGIVVLLGLGITGLIFLFFAGVFACLAGLAERQSRLVTAVVLAVDGVVMVKAAQQWPNSAGIVAHLIPGGAMLLVAIGVIAVLLDWRSLCRAPWL